MPPALTSERSRSLGRVCIVLFALSTAFPIIGSLVRSERAPRWLGVADVIVAAALVYLAIVVASRTRHTLTDRDRLTAFHAAQRVIGVVPLLLVLFFIVGERLNWVVLVVGLAWRGWLLLYSLPYLAAAAASHATEQPAR